MTEFRLGLLVTIARILHVPRSPVNQRRDRGSPFAKYAEEGPFPWLKSSIDTLRTNITKLILGVCFSGLLNKKAAKFLLHRFFRARSEVTGTDRMGSVNAS
jgi:hypothetical protein